MKAMLLNQTAPLSENSTPLELADIPKPEPKTGEVLIKVSTCGVCHTELDEIEGRIQPMKLPVVLGHQVVGEVEKLGQGVKKIKKGDRVGVGWIFSACGNCKFCKAGLENLCDDFKATGKNANGGYAEYLTVPEKHAYHIPGFFDDEEAAPLLCAGSIGYRSMKLGQIKDGDNLGLTGFGASAHLVIKLAKYRYPNTKIYVFARSREERRFAEELGAVWTGKSTDRTPEKLDCIIDTTPVWKTVVEALANLEKGGRLVINAIRKEDVDKDYLLKLSYQDHLWLEKEIKTVANVTGKDVADFIKMAAKAGIKPEFQTYPLEEANQALMDMKGKHKRGGKVLKIN